MGFQGESVSIPDIVQKTRFLSFRPVAVGGKRRLHPEHGRVTRVLAPPWWRVGTAALTLVFALSGTARVTAQQRGAAQNATVAYCSRDGRFIGIITEASRIEFWGVEGQLQEGLAPLEINEEEENANALQPPDQVMDAAGIRPGMVVGEVGAGKGRYTVHLARRVGPKGKVYANDIDENALAFLRERSRKQGFSNIETVLGTAEDPRFPSGSLDLVFMTWVYHHLERPVALLQNLIPSLRPGGRVVIVDPDSIKNRGGRSPENRSPEQIRGEAGEAGFEVVRVETFLKIDNIHILRVKDNF